MSAIPFTLTPRDRLIASYAALAIAVHILESAIPMPLPGVKPGLANIIVIIVLLRHGISAAVQVALLRIVIGSLFIGSFLTPGFILSLSGGVCSLAALALVHTLARSRTSAIGYAIAASLAHMSGQFFVAYGLFIPHPGLLSLFPLLITAALGLGVLTGIIGNRIIDRLPVLAT